MADANTELDELSRLLRQANEQIRDYGKVTKETQDAIVDAQMKAKYGVENFTKATNTAGAALGALAGAGIESTKAMYEGKKGMGAFNSSLDELSKAAALAGTALTLLIPGGIVIKGVVAGLTMAATAAIAYTKAANDMADKLYKSYTGLQKSGGAAADGMTGVFRDAKKLGLSMNELDSFVGLIADNSQDLALFAGTVYDGRKKFADMGKTLEVSRAEFFKLGLTQTEVNEGMAGYLKTVTRTGRAQTMTTDQLAASARGYIYEQDALAKITGMSVKQQQAALEKALQNEQFLSKIRQLEADGDYKKADELKKLNAYYARMGDEAAEGFQATVNGNLRNKAAQKLNFASQGEVLRSTQDVLENNKSAAQAFDSVASRVAETEKTIGRTQAAFGTTADSNLKYTEQVNFAIAAQGQKREDLEKQVNAEIEKQKKGADAITNNQGNMVKTQQDINKKLEEAVFKGIPAAQANMGRLATVTDTLANAFTTLTNGINRLLKLVGLGEKEAPAPKQMTSAEKTAARATAGERVGLKKEQERVDLLTKQLEEEEKALKDAKRSGKSGAELKPLEDSILKHKQEYEQATKDLVAAEEKVKKAAQEESKIRLKQMQDRKKLAQLEKQNLDDAEEIAKLNEQRADLVKQGKSTSAVDTKIAERKKGIEGRKAEVGQLQTELKTSASTDLKSQGLKIKEGDVQAHGADVSPNLIDLAKRIQENVPGFSYFSAFNDRYHQENSPSSKHTQGIAADFTVAEKPDKETGAGIVSWLKSNGASLAIDEYNNPSSKATAGHFHVEIPKFEDGGTLGAGNIGIAGEAGPELITGPATISSNNDVMGAFNNMAAMIAKQTGAIDELIRVAKNGNDIQTKILRIQA